MYPVYNEVGHQFEAELIQKDQEQKEVILQLVQHYCLVETVTIKSLYFVVSEVEDYINEHLLSACKMGMTAIGTTDAITWQTKNWDAVKVMEEKQYSHIPSIIGSRAL